MEIQVRWIKKPWATLLLQDDPCYTADSYEDENFYFLSAMDWGPSPVFVDAGAHQGIYSTFFASLGGIVYAFEPHPVNAEILRHNITSLPSGKVFVYQAGLGAEPSGLMLRCWNEGRDAFTGDCGFAAGPDTPDYQVPVEIINLDSLQFDRLDLIKIDVEHWELEVIRGAQQTIAAHRPYLLVEIHNNENLSRLLDFCRDLQFPFELRYAKIPNHINRFLWIQTGESK